MSASTREHSLNNTGEIESEEAALIDQGYAWEQEVFRRSGKQRLKHPQLDKDAAIKFVMERQAELNWDPVNPKTDIAYELYECVKSYLPPRSAARLEFYCAIGTVLDMSHGVDCFFRAGDTVVTIDLVFKRKVDKKADLVFSKKMTGIYLWRFAQEIALKIIHHSK